MATQTISQMNIRLNSQIKDAGDRVLAESGTTPTQIIRALWEKISCGTAALQQVEEALDIASTPSPQAGTTANKVVTMQQGRKLFAEGLVSIGISTTETQEQNERDDADLYSEALIERLKEHDLWQ